MPEIAYKEARV